MVKHNTTNNRCYVLVSKMGFWSEESLEKIVFDNLGIKPQQETSSHRNYGEGLFGEWLSAGRIYDPKSLPITARCIVKI